MKITKEYQKRFILQGIVSLFALMIISAAEHDGKGVFAVNEILGDIVSHAIGAVAHLILYRVGELLHVAVVIA